MARHRDVVGFEFIDEVVPETAGAAANSLAERANPVVFLEDFGQVRFVVDFEADSTKLPQTKQFSLSPNVEGVEVAFGVSVSLLGVCDYIDVVVKVGGVDDGEAHDAAPVVALDEVVLVEELLALVAVVEVGDVELVGLEPAETLKIEFVFERVGFGAVIHNPVHCRELCRFFLKRNKYISGDMRVLGLLSNGIEGTQGLLPQHVQ